MCKMTAGHHNSHYQHNYFLSFRYLYLTNSTPQNNEVCNDALHNYIVKGQLPPVTSNVLHQVSTMDCNNVHNQMSLLSSIPN